MKPSKEEIEAILKKVLPLHEKIVENFEEGWGDVVYDREELIKAIEKGFKAGFKTGRKKEKEDKGQGGGRPPPPKSISGTWTVKGGER